MAQKKKKLTQKEIAERARIKKKLQDDGVLPPNKPRLNRKKFARETIEEFEAMDITIAALRLREAANAMVGVDVREITSEQVGVLKCMKLAVEMDKFEKRLQQEGRYKYTIDEFVDQVYMPVMEL